MIQARLVDDTARGIHLVKRGDGPAIDLRAKPTTK